MLFILYNILKYGLDFFQFMVFSREFIAITSFRFLYFCLLNVLFVQIFKTSCFSFFCLINHPLLRPLERWLIWILPYRKCSFWLKKGNTSVNQRKVSAHFLRRWRCCHLLIALLKYLVLSTRYVLSCISFFVACCFCICCLYRFVSCFYVCFFLFLIVSVSCFFVSFNVLLFLFCYFFLCVACCFFFIIYLIFFLPII